MENDSNPRFIILKSTLFVTDDSVLWRTQSNHSRNAHFITYYENEGTMH